jgi:excinuclease ABC subunit C
VKSQDLKKTNLPGKPGVYFWKKGKEILYIGKATSLKDRVRSYFAGDLIDTRGPGILDMTVQADRVEFEETSSVLEALILEANLIKKFQPKYNVKEKDDKSFYQVIITDETWPRVIMVRSRDLKVMELTGRLSRINFSGKIKYSFGPFPEGTSLREALKIIRKLFPFRDFRSDNPDNEEFYKQLGLSPDTSTSELHREYLNTITNIKLFFEGKKGKITKELEKKMHAHAKKMEFEQAEFTKRKLFALNHINDVALIKAPVSSTVSGFRIEAYDIAHISGTSTVGVMTVVTNSVVDKAEYRKFKIKSLKKGAVDDYASLKEVVTRRFAHSEWKLPDLIVVDGGIGQYHAVAEVLAEMKINVPMVSVIKDDRHKPKGFHGEPTLIKKHKKEILLANSESHRFAITYHKQMRSKNFLT